MERAYEARRIFHKMDVDHSGFLDLEEVETLAKSLGFKKEAARVYLEHFDTNNDGSIGIEEFVEFFNVMRSPDRSRAKKLKKKVSQYYCVVGRMEWNGMDTLHTLWNQPTLLNVGSCGCGCRYWGLGIGHSTCHSHFAFRIYLALSWVGCWVSTLAFAFALTLTFVVAIYLWLWWLLLWR